MVPNSEAGANLRLQIVEAEVEGQVEATEAEVGEVAEVAYTRATFGSNRFGTHLDSRHCNSIGLTIHLNYKLSSQQ